ncbi:hypothetical protein CDAR_614361 [Caerostris darwini]|uniref:Uncharacterized protein n=1 Tax=Caerostris darwini TaxID=1538125 RepID=A0AAV4NQU6_9ARAC|nr:hypothetical protein CDAR_614361 [Caerostris darwini]
MMKAVLFMLALIAVASCFVDAGYNSYGGYDNYGYGNRGYGLGYNRYGGYGGYGSGYNRYGGYGNYGGYGSGYNRCTSQRFEVKNSYVF